MIKNKYFIIWLVSNILTKLLKQLLALLIFLTVMFIGQYHSNNEYTNRNIANLFINSEKDLYYN